MGRGAGGREGVSGFEGDPDCPQDYGLNTDCEVTENSGGS